MPFPSPDSVGYFPGTIAGQQSLAASVPRPPSYILAAMQQGGFADSQGNIDPRYRWNPDTMSLEENTYGGGSYGFGDIADPSLGTNVVMPDGTTQNFAQGVTPYSFLSAGSNYPGGIATVAEGSPEYNALRDDARTRNQQGIARVGALVGGAAALGASPWGSGATGTGTGTVTGTNLAYGATPAAGGATTAAGLSTGAGIAAAPLTGGTGAVGGGLLSGATAGAGGLSGLAGAAGAASGSWLDRFLPYISNGASALLGARAADRATVAETAALQQAIEEQRRQYDTTRQDLQPWLTAGTGALGNLQNAGTAFQASPGYDWRRSEGQRDIGNSFAARGGAASGNALRALSEFNQGLAGGEFNNWWNQQAGLAGVGQNTAVNLGNQGQNAASNVGNLLGGQGVARSSGIINRYGALGQGLTDSLNWLQRRRLAVGG